MVKLYSLQPDKNQPQYVVMFQVEVTEGAFDIHEVIPGSIIFGKLFSGLDFMSETHGWTVRLLEKEMSKWEPITAMSRFEEIYEELCPI